MGSGDAELRLRAKLEGGKQTAEGLKGIASAQDGATKKTAASATATKKATEETKKLGASESDLIGLLSAVNPALGGFVDAAIKGSKVAGDLASQNINMAGAFAKAKQAISANAGALKLLAAGGAVVIGIFAITKAIEAMRKEWELNAEAINKTIEAQTELRGEELNRKQAIEDIADSRREGGFSADEARQAQGKANSIAEKNPSLQPGAVNQAIALGGIDRSVEELSKIAFLLQSGRLELGPQQSSDVRDRIIERALSRNTEAIETAFGREGTQKKEARSEAKNQAKSAVGGNQAELMDAIKKRTDGTDLDPKDIDKIIQVLDAADDNKGKPLGGIPLASLFANRDRSRIEGELAREGLDTSGIGAPSQRAINVAREVRNDLTDKPKPVTINNTTFNNQGSTFLGSDAAARDQRIKDSGRGENARELAEG